MRDMKFKNLTSRDKSRRILWASETIDEDGILTKIHKHLIYIIKEVSQNSVQSEKKPEIFVSKCRNSKNKTEKFSVKMKGGLYCASNEKLFFVNFCQSLKIDLSKSPT